jgi:2-dehydropantoate 2-reductase
VAGVPRLRRRGASEAREGDSSLKPHVVVVGTGALASLFAARLARAGEAFVTLAGRWRAALVAVAARGITVEEDAKTWTASVTTALLDETLGPADVVLVLVKSRQTASVATPAVEALAPRGLAVTLQNGLGNRETLEAALASSGLDDSAVVVGVATLGATLLEPGQVRAFPGLVTLGTSAATSERVERLAALLRAASFPTDVTPEIDRLVWRKLAVNCAINPLTALMGVPNGALLDSPLARDSLAAAAREVGAVAAGRGIDLGVDPAVLAMHVARQTAANRSSMLQDFDRGSATEIDALCGAVAREGRRLAIPTPVNASLWEQIKRREGLPAAPRGIAG